jgi:fructokinase
VAEVVCLGEALIDFVAAESGVGVGEASGFVRAPGGAPANVAVGVTRLGRSSAFLGKVGDDPFGRFLAHTFAEAGVEVGGMVFDPLHRTGLAFVALTQDGERDFCFFRNPSADMTFAPQELDAACVTAGRIFHFGSITLIDSPARETTFAALEMARMAASLISYDPNLRPPLWRDPDTARRGILEAMPSADLVKVSEEELAFLMGPEARLPEAPLKEESVAAYAQRLLAQFPKVALLAVTRGGRGCAWFTPHGLSGSLAGLPVSAVDTTGAGDGFVAGLLVGLLERDAAESRELASLEADALKTLFAEANAVGALTTTRKGAIPSLPTAAEVAAFRRSL